MVQHRLNGCIHKEMELDLAKIIDFFPHLHPRRMRLENILSA